MWGQLINTLIGLWLMAAPGLFGYSTIAAHNNHIVGPIVITFSVVAYWEATRGVRKWNYILGLWLLLAPWILGYDTTLAIVSDIGSGILILIFASVKGQVEGTFEGGWSSLWQNNPDHLKDSSR